VGDFSVNIGGKPHSSLAEGWNGSEWSLQSPAGPPEEVESSLAAISCAGTKACTSVGQYTNGTGKATLANVWNGTGWALESTPNPAGASSAELAGVSCVSSTECSAAGSYVNAEGTRLTLVETKP
jgi:hypothetical protein